MKYVLCLSLLFFSIRALAQEAGIRFHQIDRKVSSIDASTPEILAQKLTAGYVHELEKVRAIFSWITQHISYNTGIYTKRYPSLKYLSDPIDTLSEWKSGIEMAAMRVLHRRFAVCEGYARLFKTLCDYSGIRSEIINGYARCYREGSVKFRTNHTWNAVMIDSSWYLLDLTWASGYINPANEFVQHTDESYFLTPPRFFIRDHYPEDLRWTLLESPPAASEYFYSPFRYRSFVKYSIQSFYPARGVIEAAIGDTIMLELNIRDPQKDKKVSPDPFFDSSLFTGMPASAFLQPEEGRNKISYTYIVPPGPPEWLHLLYNEDMVLRYRLKVRER